MKHTRKDWKNLYSDNYYTIITGIQLYVQQKLRSYSEKGSVS